jgi:hypothetical protein
LTTAGAGHRIRLRGPWKFAWVDDNGRVGSVEVRKHPDDWEDFTDAKAGRIRLSRTFHAPTNVEDTEQIFVVLTGVRGEGDVSLNGQSLGHFTPSQRTCEFPLPGPLPFSNELTITVSFDAATPTEPQVGVYDVVELEIRKQKTV